MRLLGHFDQQGLASLANVGEPEFCEISIASKKHEVAVPTKTDNRAEALAARAAATGLQ